MDDKNTPLPHSDEPRIVGTNESFITESMYPLVWTLIAVLAVAAATSWWFSLKSSKQEKAASLLAEASTAENWETILDQYANTPAAALARLKLAQHYASHQEFTKAADAYKAFVATFPEHPLAGTAELAMAEAYESAGQPGEAKLAYEKLIRSEPQLGMSGPATIGLARIHLSSGDYSSARTILSELIKSNSSSVFVSVAREMLRSMPPQVGAEAETTDATRE